MIGLGSNRLSVCRRGGMSVTQAGRGGMEWLGVRGPRWASPYSAQATAALKAQFPTQWPTIRDYGFAHPEIVGYMNAYAPEDAKIAYSLVPLDKKRYIRGGGNNAYFATNITMPNMADFVEAKFKRTANNQYHTIYGSYSGTDRSYDILMSNNGGFWYGNGSILRQSGGTYTLNHDFDFVVEYKNGRVITTIDGVQTWDDNASSVIEAERKFFVFARNLQGTPDCFADDKDYIESLEWRKNGSSLVWYVPFIRNGQMELLDLVSGNLATRVGTFTELIETPAS